MVVSNVEIISRKITQFSANSESGEDQVSIDGKYVIEVQNNGILPTASLSFRLDKFVYGSGNDIIVGKNKNLGRIQPSSNKKLEFTISEQIQSTPQNLGTIERSCNNSLIPCISEEKVTGTLFAKSFSRSGGVPVSSTSCSVPQLQEDEQSEEQPGTQPEPEPPSEPQDGEIRVSLPQNENFPPIVESGTTVTQEVLLENTGNQSVVPTVSFVVLDGNDVADTIEEGRFRVDGGEIGSITLSGSIDVEPGDYGIGISVNDQIRLTQSERQNETDETNGTDGADDGIEQQNESNIEGPNVLGVGQQGVYSWDDFPPETVLFRWQLLSEGGGDDAPEDETSLELAEGSGREVVLNLTSNIEGDFLLRIIASAGGERLAQESKVVSVTSGGAAA